MASLSALANSQSITTTEHSLPADATYAAGSPQTTDCITQTRVNRSAMAAGDEYRFRVYAKVNAQTARPIYEATWLGAYSDDFVTPQFIFTDDWDITLLKVAGTDRTFHWTVERVLP